jgi:hypothetical protein
VGLRYRETIGQPYRPLQSSSRDGLGKHPAFFAERSHHGIDFLHTCGDGGKYFFPEVIGSGIALLDYDRDGNLDVFVVQGKSEKDASAGPSSFARPASASSRLYRQESGGSFRDVTDEAGLADRAPYGMGVAVGDVNNDGWPDLYVTKFGADRLFVNRAGRFEDVTDSAGIANPRWGTSAAFGDFDRDGWLDLIVANYVDYYPSQQCIQPNGAEDYCHPRVFPDAPSRLFRNITGEPGSANGRVRFQDVSFDSGIDSKVGPGLGVLVEDLTEDSWQDIYIANDAKGNFLWVNQGNGTFAEEAIPAGAAYDRAGRPQASMGLTSGDVNGDGRTDLFMTHIDGEYSTLYLQLASGIFEDRSLEAGLANTIPFTGFGTALGDLDLDGDLDLVVANGRVRRRVAVRYASATPAEFWKAYSERNQLFVNVGDAAFQEADPINQPFCQGEHVGRGLAVGDIDNDGDLDLVTSEINGPVRLYDNVAQRLGSWLRIRAIVPAWGNRDAYGAEVVVKAGGLRLARTINPGSSYLSSSDARVHFGLGPANTVDGLRVRWPDGSEESFPGGEANRELTLIKGQGANP